MATREADARKAVENIRRELERAKGTHIWQDYVNALRLVSQVVFTRSSGFVLELIQNAEDAGQGLEGLGDVSITVNKDRLKFVHNGAPFDQSNLQAICGIRSSKKPERGTLGYLGIGFKSVFKVADWAEIYSSGFQFKFDRNHEEWANQVAHTPWHVIPIWIERPSEDVDPKKTTFIVHLRDEDAYQHLMSGLKDIKAELYLFLKWIKRISITDEISGETWRHQPENGVEIFAMNFAKEKLASKFSSIVEVDKLNHGYDLEAQGENGEPIQIEVKGQSTDADVELTGNEARAAKEHGETFYLCVVSSIPESPMIFLARDPDRVGEKQKLTIRVDDWKTGRWTASSTLSIKVV